MVKIIQRMHGSASSKFTSDNPPFSFSPLVKLMFPINPSLQAMEKPNLLIIIIKKFKTHICF